MNKTGIEWCDFTWNPVVGCKRGCYYCYAKRMNDRFKWIPDFRVPTFIPERLSEPQKRKKPAIIFVGSVTDFCYWENEWKDLVIESCKKSPQHTFMFLSKGKPPYWGKHFPDNCILGITLTGERGEPDRLDNFLSHHRRGFISIEPILGPVKYSKLAFSGPFTEKVIVGTDSTRGAKPPEKEWIQSVIDTIPKEKLFWKSNIKKYL